MARLVLGGSLMRGRGEVLITAPATAAASNDEPFAGLREIVQLFAGVVVVDDGPNRHGNIFRRPVAAGALAAFAVPSSLGFMLGIETEMQQRVVVFARDKNHIAAVPAIAAAGSATRDKFLAAERQTAIA